jgi:cytochrome c oxidase cbb3-type subunit II
MASSNQSSVWQKHAIFEKNSIILLLGIVVMIAIGGLVEIVPLFYLKSTIEKVEGVRPNTPLELAGFNIYIREGCYNCHSQMIRPLRDEVERYGHYSLAAESMYDHPFQWASKRTGPDLARVGGKYSDDWHRDHMRNPRAVVPASIMPAYPWLEKTPLDTEHIAQQMRIQSIVGVPYTQEMIDNAQADMVAQGAGEGKAGAALQQRYPKAIVRDLGADKTKLTELDAVIAYLQRLGNQVDFKLYDDKANIR